MSKRILSLALVVMMLAAFVPSTLFTASAAADRIPYQFNNKNLVSYTNNNGVVNGGSYTKTTNMVAAMTYENTKGLYELYKVGGPTGQAILTGTLPGTNGNYANENMQGSFMKFPTKAAGDWVALKVNIPVAASTVQYTTTNQKVATMQGYFLPADADLSNIAAAMANPVARLHHATNGYDIIHTGTAISYNPKVEDGEGNPVAKTLPAGEYILLFYVTAPYGTSTDYTLGLSMLSVYCTPSNVFAGAVSASSLPAGQTTTASVKIYNYVPETYAEVDAAELTGTITYSSTSPEVATVDPATGVITAIKGGKTTINAIYSGDATRTAGRIAGKTISVEGPGYQFKYKFTKDASCDRTDLGFTRKKGSDTNYFKTSSIVDYSMTYGAWKFHSEVGHATSGDYYGLGPTDTINLFGPGNGCYIAYDLNVPVEGTFDVTIASGAAASGKADYYLLPAGTDLSAPASISTSTPGAILLFDDYKATSATKTGVEVKKGEYILFIIIENSASNRNIRFKEIAFKTPNKDSYLTPYFGTIDPVSVTEGDTADVAAEAHIYDAYTGEAIASGISFSTASSAIATASGTTVTGVAGGTTKLNAAVSGREGNVIPGNLTVSPKGYKFKYTFMKSAAHDIPELGLLNKINPQGTANAYLESAITDYAMTHGAWKFNSQNGYTNQDYGLLDAQFIFSFSAGSGRYLALDINVPVAGTYDVTLTHNAGTIAADYFILPKGTDLSDVSAIADGVNGAQAIATNYAGTSTTKSGITLEKGEYIFLTRVSQNLAATKSIHYKSLEFATTGATMFNDAFFGTVDPVVVDKGYGATANARIYNAYTDAAYTGDVTFATENTGIATVAGKTVTGVVDGETKLNASIAGKANIIPGKVTVTNPGYKFKYGFDKTTYTIDVPELGLYRELNQDGKVCYHIRSITDYAMTKGAWKFNSDSGFNNYGYGLGGEYLIHSFVNGKAGRYLAIDLNVPVAGTYDVSVTNGTAAPKADYFLVPGGTDLSDIATIENAEGAKTLFTEYSGTANAKTATGIDLTKGTHTLVIRIDDEAAGKEVTNFFLKSVEIVTTGATAYIPAYFGTADSAYVVEGTTKSANARIYDTYSYAAYEGDVTFAIDGVSASLSGKTITGEAEGYATISATVDAPARIISGKVTVGNAALTDAFNATKTATEFNAAAPTAFVYLKDGTDTADTIDPVDGVYTAPEKEGYTFLYWAKGLGTVKRILGFDAELSYKPTNGMNVLIAVYEAEGAVQATKAEFYSGMGQLVATLTEDGVAPELPEMPGYNATVWMNVAKETLNAGDAVELEADVTEIWVAQYEEADDITVTAVSATGGATVKYGELVTLEANIPEGKTFRYWTKKSGNGGAEIVGFKSKTYSFYAWEDCTVEAVYGDAAPIYNGGAMKILIDLFGNNSVMAEFIGFSAGSILEKGIRLDGTDFAMTSDDMQFSLSDIGKSDVTGYAIIKSGDTVYRIEDGE